MTVRKIEAQQPTEVKKLRVAAYCRVSTDQDDQRESLEAQKQHYESWIKLHSDWEFAGVFYDFGISGTKADVRDELQALMYECRSDASTICLPNLSAVSHVIQQTAYRWCESCFPTIFRSILKKKIWIPLLWKVS